jgi:Toprim domain-containing protein/MCM2/3/5 family protein
MAALKDAASLLARWVTGVAGDDGEQRGYCPLCENPGESTTPSASFNFKTGLYQCFSNCGGMSLRDLIKMLREDGSISSAAPSPPPAAAKAARRGNLRAITDAPSAQAAGKLPSEELLEQYTDRLLASAANLRLMRDKRGLTVETIEKFGIGYHDRKFTIPIRDEHGELVNVRRYNPTASQPKDKMVSWARGTGSRRLFLPDALLQPEVILVEGEMDALVGRQYGLNTMSHTAGATAWNQRWNLEFEGKVVFICYDCDDAGRRGARKVEGQLQRYAKDVHIINLPLKTAGADLTDYFVEQGFTAVDFKALMEEVRGQVSKAAHLSHIRSRDPKPVTLEASMDGRYHEVPLTFTATVAGKVQPAYMMPRVLEFNCNEGGGARCARCPISGRNHMEVEIPEHDPLILELVDKSSDASKAAELKHSGIPHTCPDVQVDEREMYSVEELICVPPADEQVGSINPVDRRVYNVGQFNTPVNTKISFVGVNTTSAKDRRAALQTWVSDQTTTNLEEFTMTPEMKARLSTFHPTPQQSPIQKMMEIAKDLEANVTRIYGRKELHLAYDLVWHSVLNFRFKGVDVGKGWLELLVIGDTRTGKSEAAHRLCSHYRSGVLTTCEGATFAGLVGGAQQMANTWMVSWGTIPLNDRRLVVLDEFGGIAGKGIIEQMSSVRSSGKAQINKIVKQETSARTRLIWIANPADGRKLNELSNGAIDAIKGLANNPEDVARFDFAIAVASEAVDSATINTDDPPVVTPRYTKDLCSDLVCWAWSRTLDQIVWQEGVEKYVLDQAQEIGGKYINEPPLIQIENVRLKIARMAVAVAARLFSSDTTGEVLVVKEEHVLAAVKLLHRFYRQEGMGYAQHSARVLKDRENAKHNRETIIEYLRSHHAIYEALQSVRSDPFKLRDFEEFAAMSRLEAQDAVRVLQQHRMIRRQSKGYIRAEPGLVDILKQLDTEWED